MSSQSYFFNPQDDRMSCAGSGLQLPRLSTSQRLALSVGPGDAGLQIFDITIGAEYLWDGASWIIGGYSVSTFTDATAAVTLTANMFGGFLVLTSAAPVVVSVPATLPADFFVTVCQYGTGIVTFSGAGGATVRNRQGIFATAGQYALTALVRIEGTNDFILGGDVL
jgi:hypothetical protein